MKRYRVAAVVKCVNKRVGFYLADCNGVDSVDLFKLNWIYVKEDDMLNIVKDNAVRCIVASGSIIKCELTKEEREVLDSLDSDITTYRRDFWDNLPTFTSNQINLPLSGIVNDIWVTDIVSIYGNRIPVLWFVLHGNMQALQNFVGQLKSKGVDMYDTTFNNVVLRLSIALFDLDSFINVCKRNGLVINTSKINHIANKIQNNKFTKRGFSCMDSDIYRLVAQKLDVLAG